VKNTQGLCPARWGGGAALILVSLNVASLTSLSTIFVFPWVSSLVGIGGVFPITTSHPTFNLVHILQGTKIPTFVDILEQIKVSLVALPGYAALPATTEFLVERGLTRVYSRVDQYGLAGFFGLFFLYMCCVEFWVYWVSYTYYFQSK